MIDETTIPETLRVRSQWICWRSEKRNGKSTKVPIDPKSGSFASSTDDRTWSDLEKALEYLRSEDVDGIGFVFTKSDPIVGIDLDECRDAETGRPEPDAKAIVKHLDSYTEVSPSGTGYHVLVLGELPEGRNRRGQIEIYEQARFFTVTTDHVPGTPTEIYDRQAELEAIHEEHVQEPPNQELDSSEFPSDSRTPTTLSTEVLLEKAKNASNGEKFQRLWNGNTGGYESQSEADMALCCLLAFWTGGEQRQIDQLFRESGLYREKWDDVHYADGSTYGEKTITRATKQTSEFYEPIELSKSTVQNELPQEGEFTEKTNSKRHQVYLEEKNRILTERVSELEGLLERKNKRIESLEMALENIKQSTIDQPSPSQQTEQSQSVSGVWRRIKRML